LAILAASGSQLGNHARVLRQELNLVEAKGSKRAFFDKSAPPPAPPPPVPKTAQAVVAVAVPPADVKATEVLIELMHEKAGDKGIRWVPEPAVPWSPAPSYILCPSPCTYLLVSASLPLFSHQTTL
jgi:hypothetical protein